jgi:hypothetical protein
LRQLPKLPKSGKLEEGGLRIVSWVWEGWVESEQVGGMAECGGGGRTGTYIKAISGKFREEE